MSLQQTLIEKYCPQLNQTFAEQAEQINKNNTRQMQDAINKDKPHTKARRERLNAIREKARARQVDILAMQKAYIAA